MVERLDIRANDQTELLLQPSLAEVQRTQEAPRVTPGAFLCREEWPEDGLLPAEFIKPEFQTPELIAKHRFATPLTEQGTVDVADLIRRVNATVEPEYSWPGRVDLHHLYWPCARYESADKERGTDAPSTVAYRELAMNKIRVPRLFHTWLHTVTVPPPMPSVERMQESLEEWQVIRSFFERVQVTTQTVRRFDRERQRRQNITEQQEEILQRQLARKFGGLMMSLSALQSVPLEHWPFSSDLTMQRAAGQVGRLVRHGHLQRTRAVRTRAIPQQRVA